MTVLSFFIGAVLLLVIGFLGLVIFKFKVGQIGRSRGRSNLDILRGDYEILESRFQNGDIDRTAYEEEMVELELRAQRDEIGEHKTQAAANSKMDRFVAAGLIFVMVPIGSLGLYLKIGQPEAHSVTEFVENQKENLTLEQLGEILTKIQGHLKDDPSDVEGWVMLGRTLKGLGRFDESVSAWKRAYELSPDDANLLVDYAEALTLVDMKDHEPGQLIDRALRYDPKNIKGLALGGSIAFANADYDTAIKRWSLLASLVRDDEDLVLTLKEGVAEASRRLGNEVSADPGASLKLSKSGETSQALITGRLRLDERIRDLVLPTESVFIFVRAVDGPPMPIAALKVEVKDLPLEFSIGDNESLQQSRKLSEFTSVLVGARVSKSGNAIEATGDLVGEVKRTSLGSKVDLVIDRRVE
jgi:cytochrome c-type biogenesis protein CcmH